jgi:hypothetical protein
MKLTKKDLFLAPLGVLIVGILVVMFTVLANC